MGRKQINTYRHDEIAKRREDVARLRLRGHTQRQIGELLNISAATVNHDLAYLKDEWRASALASMEEHKTQVLAELEEVKRAAWAVKDMHAVLKALKAISDLLGLDAPMRVEETVTVNDSRATIQRKFAEAATGGTASDVHKLPN